MPQIRIVSISPYPEMERIVQDVIAAHPQRGRIDNRIITATVDRLDLSELHDCDAIIARGYSARRLKAQGLKIPVWAVQFCPPAPLGNTGLVSYGHKSFFCFFILPLPTLSPHRGIGPHLSAFSALTSHAFTHLPCIWKGALTYPTIQRSVHGHHGTRRLGMLTTIQSHASGYIYALHSTMSERIRFQARSALGGCRSSLPAPLTLRKTAQNILSEWSTAYPPWVLPRGQLEGPNRSPMRSGIFWVLLNGNLGMNLAKNRNLNWRGLRSGGFLHATRRG